MTASLAYGSSGSWFDPATGAVKQVSLYYYRAGTLDPITVYTTSDLSIPHGIPVLTSGYGRVPHVWIDDQPNPGYRMRAFDQWSTLVEDLDNIPTPSQPAEPGEPSSALTPEEKQQLLVTGDIIPSFSNAQPRAGFVLCNGGAIAKAGSTNAVDGGRASDDTYALFLWLWGQDIFGMLEVIPSRGTTAQGDWDGNKGIRTPNLQGRFAIGMSPMGAGAVSPNLLNGLTFTKGDQATVGAYGGAVPIKALTLAEMPAHTHAVTETSHFHTLNINSGGENVDHAHYFNANSGTESQNHTHYLRDAPTTSNGSHDHDYKAVTESDMASGLSTGTSNSLNIDKATSTDGAHTHTVSGTTEAESATHFHNVQAWTGGRNTGHIHNVFGQTASNTTGGIALASMGGGTPWQMMSPFLQLCFYIKL